MMKICIYKYRLYPTKKQKSLLLRQLELCRLLYNHVLELRKATYEAEKKTLSCFDCNNYITEYKHQNGDKFNCINATVLMNVSERLDLAFKGFFRRIKQGKAGYPRFKSFNRYDSMTYPQAYSNNGCRLLDNKFLRLQHIGAVKIVMERPLEGKLKRLTIKRENDKWFACFVLEQQIVPRVKIEKSVIGIDLGISAYATLSNGQSIANPKLYNAKLKQLKKAQRKLSLLKQKPHDDPKKLKAKKVLSALHCKVKNQRNDFLHKLSRSLVEQYSTICVEDLSIESMLKDGWTSLNRNINDCSWGSFIQKLDYKAEEAGCQVIKVNPRGTSKICSQCGAVVEKLLSEREHKCQCGLIMDRDLNAALNILRLGLQSQIERSESPSRE